MLKKLTNVYIYYYDNVSPSEILKSLLPVLKDNTLVPEIHQEMTSSQSWALPGLKASAQLAWAVMLRQISQFNVGNGEKKMIVSIFLCTYF